MKKEGKAVNEKGKGKLGSTTQRTNNVAANKGSMAGAPKAPKGNAAIITKITGGAYSGMKKRGA